jgi:cytochrome b subunit of formate dehydrogenase
MDFNNTELPSNKKFGIFFAIIFFISGVYFFGSLFSSLFFTLSGIFIFIAILKPELLLPLNRFWMMLGILLGRIISPIILGVIFFGFFVPISIITRMFGRDELSLKIKSKKSFWKIRESESLHSDNFKLQF